MKVSIINVGNPDAQHPSDIDVTIRFSGVKPGIYEKVQNLISEISADLADGKISLFEGISIGGRVYDLIQ